MLLDRLPSGCGGRLSAPVPAPKINRFGRSVARRRAFAIVVRCMCVTLQAWEEDKIMASN